MAVPTGETEMHDAKLSVNVKIASTAQRRAELFILLGLSAATVDMNHTPASVVRLKNSIILIIKKNGFVTGSPNP